MSAQKSCKSVILTHKDGRVYHWQLPVVMLLDDGSTLRVEGTLDSNTFTEALKPPLSRLRPENAFWDVRGIFANIEVVE